MTQYQGYKISTKRIKDRTGFPAVELRIAGHFVWSEVTCRDKIADTVDKLIGQAKRYIDDSISRPEAYSWSR